MEESLFYELLSGSEYFTLEDLRYNKKVGYCFSKEKYETFIAYKKELLCESDNIFQKIPLKTFNSKYLFFADGKYLQSLYNEYLNIVYESETDDQSNLFSRNMEDILFSRAVSEVEGTLRIENVATTQKRIIELYRKEIPENQNDVIVVNMINAMKYIVNEKPAFNKENLRKLYCMLSENCLSEEDRLAEGQYYRDGFVQVDGFEGAEYKEIDTLMDSLFSFVNDKDSLNKYGILLPHICHYYIVYVHPYFDYNGRTARMVSFWINSLYNEMQGPLFISEAINENKKNYYNALRETRNNDNDLTFFLGYILKTAVKFGYIYKNLEEIKKMLSKDGNFLSKSEPFYLKKILIHNPENYFNTKMFIDYINSGISHQGVMKILNGLTEKNVLIKGKNKKGEYIFKVNPNCIFYKYED